MEIIALALVVGIWLAHEDRKTMKRMFPPSTCLFCGVPIQMKKDDYIHMDDKKKFHFKLSVIGYGKPVEHAATPQAGQPWELYGDDDYELVYR